MAKTPTYLNSTNNSTQLAFKTSSYAILNTDLLNYIIASGNGTTITLPNPSGNLGRIITIECADPAFITTVAHYTGSNTIDGITGSYLLRYTDRITLRATTTLNWEILGLYTKSRTYNTNSYLTSNDFPNVTNLYGWKANTSNAGFLTTYGGKDLTLNGGGLTPANNDHLGISTYCTFDGSADYLSYSADSSFDFTGTFSIEAWVYVANWASVSASVIVEKWNGGASSGWGMKFTGDGRIAVFVNVGTFWEVTVDHTGLSAGWHHISFVRNDTGTNTGTSALYIDGLLLGKTAVCTDITVGTTPLTIGARSTGTQYLAGRVTDVWVQNGYAWSSSDVKKIYARGSGRKSYLDINNNLQMVDGLPLEGKWFNYTSRVYDNSKVEDTSINNARTGYMVRGNFVTYSFHATGLLNTGGSSYYVTIPIQTVSSYNNIRGTAYAYKGGAAVYPTATYNLYLDGSNFWIEVFTSVNWSTSGGDEAAFQIVYPWQ